MVQPILKPCVVCGQISAGSRCPKHKDKSVKATPTQRGYDYQWQKLSKRARRMQPFCLDCGSTKDLQCDHTPEAWERKRRGLPIRLKDVAVVCRPCNIKRGAARGPNARSA